MRMDGKTFYSVSDRKDRLISPFPHNMRSYRQVGFRQVALEAKKHQFAASLPVECASLKHCSKLALTGIEDQFSQNRIYKPMK